MSRTKISHNIYKDIKYDSKEEVEFQIFLDEAKEIGLVKSFQYQPQTFELIPKALIKVNGKDKTLLRAHNYTADWKIIFNSSFDRLPHKWVKNNDGSYLVDVKGSYNLHGGDRIFPIHQKLLYFTHGLYVNKVIPKEFFQKINICPEGVRWNKARKEKILKKDYKNIGTFADFIKSEKEFKTTGKQINIKFLKPREG